MDYREQVFKMLGVKPNEEFYLKRNGVFFVRICAEKGEDRYLRFYLDKNLELYMVLNGWSEKGYHTLSDILLGVVEIVKLPKEVKPTKEEQIAIDYAMVCGYKWLAKDKNGKVYAYKEKPIRITRAWGCNCGNLPIEIPVSFLSWEDDEPYYIGGEENA